VLWSFISTYNIILMDRKYKLPLLQCEGDEFIMECLVMSGRFDDATLFQINWCRLKQQVLRMVNIIAGEGVHLQRNMHVYTHTVGVPTSQYNWAKEELRSGNWILWQHALKAVTLGDGTLPFFDSLGWWITPPH